MVFDIKKERVGKLGVGYVSIFVKVIVNEYYVFFGFIEGDK